MRKIATLLSSILILSLSFTASAFEADFSAKIRGVNTENDNARVISTAHFQNTNIQNDGTFTVAYSVTDDSGNLIFTGSAEINAAETEVTVGTRNTGKITMQHDLVTGLIKTRFVKKVIHNNGSGDTPSTNYNIVANSGSWSGEATITSRLESQELVYPEQITITASNVTAFSGVDFFANRIIIIVDGKQVYSEPFLSERENEQGFSITVNTDLDSGFECCNKSDIILEVQGEYDGGPLSSHVSTSLFADKTVYDFGEVTLSPIPQ